MDRQGAAQVALSACPCIFFFSSRRRHTRLQGDWSSDVCSSDLFILGAWLAWRAAGDEGASGILRMPLLAALFFFLALLSKETALAFLVVPVLGLRRMRGMADPERTVRLCLSSAVAALAAYLVLRHAASV